MKRLLLTLLIAALPLLAQAKKGILRYEYSDGESYYALEIDTLTMHGQLNAYVINPSAYRYETAVFRLIVHVHNYRDGETWLRIVPFSFTTWAYPGLPNAEKSRYNGLISDSEDLGNPYGRDYPLSFRYEITGNGRRLEYGDYDFEEDDHDDDRIEHYDDDHWEKRRLSPFLSRGSASLWFPADRHHVIIEWFPPWMTRVKEFDYDRFPEGIREYIKKGRLK